MRWLARRPGRWPPRWPRPAGCVGAPTFSPTRNGRAAPERGLTRRADDPHELRAWPSTREREGADMAPRLVCGIRVAAHVLGAVQEAPSAWPALGRCGVGATSSSASREPCATRACRCARPSTSSPTRSLWSASAQPWPSTPVETEPRPAGARADAGRKPLPVRNSRRRGTPTPPPARLCRAGGSPTGIGCWPTPIRWRAP